MSAKAALAKLDNETPSKSLIVRGMEGRNNYWKQHGDVTFVACPFGHGLDTHRIWEALLLEAVPIVATSPLDKLYKEFPIIIIDKWEDISSLSDLQTLRDRILTKFGDNPFAKIKKKLFNGYWNDMIQEKKML